MTIDAQAFGAHLEAVFLARAARRQVGAGAVYQAELNLDEEFENFFIERYLAANPGTGESLVSGHQPDPGSPSRTAQREADSRSAATASRTLSRRITLNDELTTTLVYFDWISSAPMSSSAQLGLLDFAGARAYVCWAKNEDTQQPWTAIAAVEPKNDPDVMSAVFELPPGSEYFLPTGIGDVA